jgi:hypothetical protein
MSNQAGKGDKYRPVEKSKYDENFDKIEWKKTKKDVKEKNLKKGIVRYTY